MSCAGGGAAPYAARELSETLGVQIVGHVRLGPRLPARGERVGGQSGRHDHSPRLPLRPNVARLEEREGG
jgi:hypothetical protein